MNILFRTEWTQGGALRDHRSVSSTTMNYNINVSPSWISELGLIDDLGPEIDPRDIPSDTACAVAVKLKSGRVHLISWKHLEKLPENDPPVAAFLADIMIDEYQLFKASAC